MFCPQCGTSCADGDQFCRKCGASLGTAPAKAEPEQWEYKVFTRRFEPPESFEMDNILSLMDRLKSQALDLQMDVRSDGWEAVEPWDRTYPLNDPEQVDFRIESRKFGFEKWGVIRALHVRFRRRVRPRR